MSEFSINYLWEKYRDLQKEVCSELGAVSSDTLLFGLSKDEKYKMFSRSGVINRLCITKILESRA